MHQEDSRPQYRGLEDFAADAQTFASDRHRFAVVFNTDILKRFQVLLDVGPFETITGFVETTLQFFPERQRQETAEHMSSDCFIPLVKDRSGFQN